MRSRKERNGLIGQSVSVIGLGASGVAAARLAAEQGGDVYVSDSCENDAAAARGANLGDGVDVELGRHDIDRITRSDVVIASPGIPPDAPVLRELAARGVSWVSEPEFASRFYAASLVAITGTNGKTTTTMLVEHLLKTGGLHAAAGGNVGGGLAPPASELALAEDPYDWVVLEMSSFQLAGVETFQPDIGVVTNLSPDHLDRYDGVDSYYADKARLFESADERSRWVLPSGDREVEELAGDAAGERFYFGHGSKHAFVADEWLTLSLDGAAEPLVRKEELPLLGAHNVTNALTAALVAGLAGIESDAIAEGLRSARPLPHRLEALGTFSEVLWVNDSKATNVAAAASALESIDAPIVLLVGGTDKGEPFRELAEAVRATDRAVLVYGEVGPRLYEELTVALADRDGPPIERVPGSLARVVERAREVARPGDTVLLSPACSSFDMYDNYERRGQDFARLVRMAS